MSTLRTLFVLIIHIESYHSYIGYIGCYKYSDYANDAIAANGFSIASCSDQCRNYPFFSMQNGTNCYCKNTFSQGTQYLTFSGCLDGTGGHHAAARDVYAHCSNVPSICNHTSSILTDDFAIGENPAGLWIDALNQGRVHSIDDWGYYTGEDHQLYIGAWYADKQTTFDSFSDTTERSELTPCDPVQLANDDYIVGYKLWLSPLSSVWHSGRLTFYSRYGHQWTCGHPDFDPTTATAVYNDTFFYDIDNFWYLSGFYGNFGTHITRIGFQFTRFTFTESTTSSIPSLDTSASTKLDVLACGDTINGVYSDEMMSFFVQLTFDGTLVFDASNSDFYISSLQVAWGTLPQGSDIDHDAVLSVMGIAGEYMFMLRGEHGAYGTYNIQISCYSAPSTSAETTTSVKENTKKAFQFVVAAVAALIIFVFVCGLCIFYKNRSDMELIRQVTLDNVEIDLFGAEEGHSTKRGANIALDNESDGSKSNDEDAHVTRLPVPPQKKRVQKEDNLLLRNTPRDDNLLLHNTPRGASKD